MPRLQLFEFLDQAWFPGFLRDSMTAYLETIERLMPLEPFAEKVQEVIIDTGSTQIIDLGSGSSGPILHLLPQLETAGPGRLDIRLTDLYPSAIGIEKVKKAGLPNVTYETRPVNASHPPEDLHGMRTLFAAFHHYPPSLARKVLEDAFNRRAPIGVFEFTVRSAATILTAPLIPIFVLLLTPMIRPLRWHQIVLTYLIPVLPLLIFWDGLVSHIRAYSEDELRELVEGLDASDYRWEIGALKSKFAPVGIPYLVGKPI